MAKKTYKQAVNRLQEILNLLENEPPDLDNLTELIKEASGLLNQCKKALRSTELDISNAIDKLSEPLE